MNILVTGAGGFLGLNLIKKLLDKGHNVFGLTKKTINFSHNRLHIILSDLFDINKFEGLNIDVVFHTASRINFDESKNSISELTRDNIISTFNLADFVINNKISKFIYSSTCSVYQDNYDKNKLISEEYPLKPRNSYAVSKLASEWILENKFKGIIDDFIILRYSSIYGFHQREGSIVPKFIRNV